MGGRAFCGVLEEATKSATGTWFDEWEGEYICSVTRGIYPVE